MSDYTIIPFEHETIAQLLSYDTIKIKAMLMIIVENVLWCTGAACFIRMNNLAERVHQRPLKQQQYCLTKPK